MRIFKNLIDNLIGSRKPKFKYTNLLAGDSEKEFFENEAALHKRWTGFIYTLTDLIGWVKDKAIYEGRLNDLVSVPKGIDAEAYLLFPYRFIVHRNGIAIFTVESDGEMQPSAIISKHGLIRPALQQGEHSLNAFVRFFNAKNVLSEIHPVRSRVHGTYLKEIDGICPEDFPALRQLLLKRGIPQADLTFIPRRLKKCDIFVQFANYCKYVQDEEILAEQKKKEAAEDLFKREAQEARKLEEQAKSEARNAAKEEKSLKREVRRQAKKEEKRLRHEAMLEEHKRLKVEKSKISHAPKEDEVLRKLKHEAEQELYRTVREHRATLLHAITKELPEDLQDSPGTHQAAGFLIKLSEQVQAFDSTGVNEGKFIYYTTEGFKGAIEPLSDEVFVPLLKAFLAVSQTDSSTLTELFSTELERRGLDS